MAARHLRTLRLESRQVRTAVEFFESYATYVLAESPARQGDESALADAATSLRIAGQWAMLLDAREASDLLTRSAEIWHRMQYGFGFFLLAAVAPDQLSSSDLTRRLALLAAPYDPGLVRRLPHTGAEPVDQGQRLPAPLLHPQQQGYPLLAGAAMGLRLDLPAALLRTIVERSPHRQGVAPMGALGTPLRVYWRIADRLLTRDNRQTAELVAGDLAAMAASYAQAIDSAMANGQLWFNAAAPVDVGDLDIAAIALAAALRLGPDLTKEHLRIAAEGLGATARVPLELASEMIDTNSTGGTRNTSPSDR